MTAMDRVTIGGLAHATGTKVETIRYYERIGLLPLPTRTGGNYRTYGPAQVERLSFIRRGRDLGFSLPEIRELLRLSDDRERPCAKVDQIARAHLRAIERKLADLQALHGRLQRLVEHSRHGSVAECRIIDALTPDAPASWAG